MSTDLVRPSRDGDQFHYIRGARLCLEMLPESAALAAVSIEGVPAGEDIEPGLEVIDLGLYYGSPDFATAERIHYRQFKHSTLHTEDEWTASGLRKTLEGFAGRYVELVDRFGREDVTARFIFEFETNRPIASAVIGALEDLTAGVESKRSSYLRKVIGLSGEALQSFASILKMLPGASNFLGQRELLERDFRAYLPDNDKDAPLKLKDLVARKATSEFAKNPEITRLDVLKAIGADIRDLFPAPALIEVPEALLEREQMQELLASVEASPGSTILYADGGVGKSVVATRIGSRLPEGSESFVYDCFGNGGYRSASGYRHRPRDGLVQLANEMASASLCDPLIPTSKAEDPAFVQAFMARVAQASSLLAERSTEALLCLVIDAADNAEMAAAEANDGPSFPRLLLRENFPDNVRVVLTARPHRVPLLNPPPHVRQIELHPFSEDETALNLRSRFSGSSLQDAREFHRLTSHNPRVQRVALEAGTTLADVLAKLGPTPRTVEDTIGALLDQAIASVRDAAVGLEQTQIDRLCTALATLRPFVPLDVVAATAHVPVELVRSIAHDLGRPLLIREDAVQFRDEPTETWFRQRFRPTPDELSSFVTRLRPLTAQSAYVAAVLPQLMLEAGQFDALVDLALSGEALPEESAIARRDVELQRLQFALKAALRSKRFPEAAKLALKAGGEAAADARQQRLLSANTDLASRFLEANQLVEQVSRRLIVGGSWTGSEAAYEAALLSGNSALGGDARGRLRIAYDWVGHWARSLGTEESDHQQNAMQDKDIAELQLAELNLHGPNMCAAQLRRWRPREVSFRVGLLLVRRLVDAGRFEEIDALAIAAGNDLGFLLAIAVELAQVGRSPPKPAVKRAVALAFSRHVRIKSPGSWDGERILVGAITALVTAAVRHRTGSKRVLASLLGRYLPKGPPRSLYSNIAHVQDDRFTYLRAYVLRAALRNTPLALEALAHSDIRKSIKEKHDHDPDARRFREDVGALLPWHELWTQVQLGIVALIDLPVLIEKARERSRAAEGHSYGERSATSDEVARLWAELLLTADEPAPLWQEFERWMASLKQPLYVPTLTYLVRCAAREEGQQRQALTLAQRAFALIESEREDAESKAESYVLLARAILLASEAEARQYFELAILVSGRIGDENLSRWQALLHLAEASGRGGRDDPETAYRLARAAELTYDYVARDKHFDWEYTTEALVGLSARSGPAILSRWMDRRFGREERLLPELVSELVKRGRLDPRDSLPLIAIRAWWEYEQILEDALCVCKSERERESAARFAVDYMQFAGASSHRWRRVQELLDKYALQAIDVAPMLRRAQRTEAGPEHRERTVYAPTAEEKGVDWDAIFEGVNLTNGSEIEIALQRYRALGLGFYREELLKQAYERVRAGEESAFIDALSSSCPLDLYDTRALLQSLPLEWKNRLSVRPALARFVKESYRRSAFSVSVDRHYQLLPIELASDAAGLSPRDLIAEAVDAIGATALPVGAGGLFQLVGLLAQLVTGDAAHHTLQYGLDLLEPALRPNDGDGPWSETLFPPESVEASIAGYIWGALGSPVAARRWEAAHAVRALCRLGRKDLLRALVARAETDGAGPFADAQLHFYRLHALQWLLLALSRASQESGAVVAEHEAFLRRHASRENPHVLIRQIAADAVLALHHQHELALSDPDAQALRGINRSSLQPIQSKSYERDHLGRAKRPYEEHRFVFGYDFPKYWLAPLGRAFAISEEEMEIEAEKVIRDDWGLEENGNWDRDARAARGFFRDEWRRGQGSASRNDDLRFYLGYHATMTTAGKLLETHPLHEDPEDDWSSFGHWLADHGLTRRDGLWLTDRRDSTPAELEELPKYRDEEWPGSLSDEDLMPLLRPREHGIVVAGWWTTYAGRRRQRTSINSALVTAARTDALGRALQTARSPQLYKVPDYDDHLEIDQNGYAFKGWISETGSDRALDEFDPWAADISSRFFVPALPFVEMLGIKPDLAERIWRDSTGEPQLWLDIWSEGTGEDDSRAGGGKRLIASSSLLDRLMEATGLNVLFEISVERKLAYDDYERRRGKEGNNGAEITGIFTLKRHQGLTASPRGHSSRRETRRRTRT